MAEPALETEMPATVMMPDIASAKVTAIMSEVTPWMTVLKPMVTKPAVTTKVAVVPAAVATEVTPVEAPPVTAAHVTAVAEIMLAKFFGFPDVTMPFRSLRRERA